MSLRISVLQHVPFETPGALENWAANRGHHLAVSHLYRDADLPDMRDFDWLVLLGGPMGVGDVDRFPWLTPETRLVAEAIDADRTVLGFCLGAQLIARALGAAVEPSRHREIGWFPVARRPDAAPLFNALPNRFPAFHWHGDTELNRRSEV
jgi:GMP synthase-like glutamine amidotransferase